MKPPINIPFRAIGPVAVLLLTAATASAQSPVAPATTAPDTMPVSMNHVLLLTAIFQVIVIVSLSSIMRTLGAHGGTRGAGARRAGTLLLLIGAASQAHAAGGGGTFTSKELFWWLVSANILLFVILMFQVGLMRFLTKTMLQQPERILVTRPERTSRAVLLWRRLADRVPMEREQDILLDHDYDGIRELDNVLPPWWLWLFYGTIAWGIIYLINVHVINVWPHQQEEYLQEMATAKADIAAYQAQFKELVDENTVTKLVDGPSLASGASIFNQNCIACHGNSLEGKEGLGPNLTDAYWKHGGGIKNVFHTITYGVPEKGMISWKAQLKPLEIQAVASYILSLQGSNPQNAKAPEGDLWTESVATPDTTIASMDSTSAPGDTTNTATTAP